jgi:Cu/Ag efflux protein CusF
MKLIGTCLFVLVLLASAAVAGPESARLSTAGGQIASIDSAANMVVVKVVGQTGESQDLSFVVAEDSKIVKGGAAVTLGDLKQGDKVTVTYQAKGGKNVIVNIGVESKS